MKPYWQDNFRTVYNKSCNDMSELPDESVQCCVTSPPYWGLRKYAGEQTIQWPDDTFYPYGLEPTPAMYVSHSIEILREIRRVLRKDGVVFWNIGDSYYGSGKGIGSDHGKAVFTDNDIVKIKTQSDVLKPKDLCLIPFRVAIAAQEDGWWVRSVIIWDRPNAMPESVKDRPTESHEYILMLTKSANYYWNQEAVREPMTESTVKRSEYGNNSGKMDDYRTQGLVSKSGIWDPEKGWRYDLEAGRNLRSVWTFSTHGYKEAHFATFPEELPERCIKAGSKEGDIVLDPFAGSGTSLWVAKKLGRKAVGYELSSEYCELIIKRNRQQVML
jgi:DNA modification methylase